MQIDPRYEGPAIVQLAGDGTGGDAALGAAVGAACVRQRRRLAELLGGLDDAAWRAPSRCDGWTAQDVAIHLETVNRFWQWSISAGLAGTPTRVLENFDPKATPAAMVDATRSGAPAPADTLAALVDSTEALCAEVAALDGDQWATLAEAPAGHIPITALVHHALWDCWIHERDIALPLGMTPVEEPDEVLCCLRFAAALGPAFAVQSGTSEPATLRIDSTDPAACVVVEVGTDRVTVHDGAAASTDEPTVVLRDRGADLVEALSIRTPLAHDVPDEHRWLVASLADVFEAEPAGG
jgi:uncharacterized protein (TIGR03083 family)